MRGMFQPVRLSGASGSWWNFCGLVVLKRHSAARRAMTIRVRAVSDEEKEGLLQLARSGHFTVPVWFGAPNPQDL